MGKVEPLRIAPSRCGGYWTVKDWEAIDLANEEGWKKAIIIFEDRIRGRFLKIIDQIKCSTFSGFAIMALDCLLIETLQQFYEGVEETPRRQNQEYFCRFLKQTSFNEFFDECRARMFYQQIRNGILHQAETKGSSRIWIREGTPLVEYADDGNGLLINRNKFHEQLVHEFENYVAQLRRNNPPDNGLRERFKRKMDSICRVGKERRKLGILGYGSLLNDLGRELQGNVVERIRVETPFEVEYARTSKGRSGAPTLVPIKDGNGNRVHGCILVLKPQLSEEDAFNILYRREINCIGEKSVVYDDKQQREKKDTVVIEKLENFGGVSVVLCACLKPNIGKILEENLSAEEKAKELASLAVGSVMKDTFCARRDGIQYFADAVRFGIQTPLTDLYKEEILRQAGNVSNLKEARLQIARRKGILK